MLDVMKRLREKPIEVLYWEGSKVGFNEIAREKIIYPTTIFHNTFLAAQGFPAEGVDATSFKPVGKELAQKLLECESQALSMMNAVDLQGTPLSKKKHIYYEYVRYWHGILTALRPDAIIFGDIPHLPHHYVIYCLAQMFSIKTVMMKRIAISGRIIFFDSIKNYAKLQKKLEETAEKNFQLNDLSADIREYYETQTDPSTDASPFYIKKAHIEERSAGTYPLPSVRSIARNIARFTFFKTSLSYLRMFFNKREVVDIGGFNRIGFVIKAKEYAWDRIKKSFKQEYERLQASVDFSKKFIYVPLQNQPECSTSAMGDIFTDQILMIKILRASIPPDWALYVKENPIQWGGPRTHTGRYAGYYLEIAKMENTRLVPVSTSTFKMIEHAQAVATVSSTAGLEAILRRKPALVFGNIFYMYCDGVFRVSDVDSCKKAIEKIQAGYVPSSQKILRFLAAVDAISVRGFPNKKFQEGENLEITREENVKNIAEGFWEEITA